MTLRSPTSAMLWELWRVTRAEIAWKLALPLGAALVALALGAAFAPPDSPAAGFPLTDFIAALALTLIVIPHLVAWPSMAKLNGGQPGFPLYLGYTRPVRTAVLVGLPMAYLVVVSSAIYLASAMVLRVISGYAFPLLPVAGWMAALTLVFVAAGWSTRNWTIAMAVAMLAIVKAWGWSMDRLTAVEIPDNFDWPPHLWPSLFDWPRTDYAWIALIGLASFGVTVAGVARQRRGEGWLQAPPAPRQGSWDGLVGLFRFPCPSSSATRAQLWFDLKSNGLPVLTIGVVLAIVIVAGSVVGDPFDAALNTDKIRAQSCFNNECFAARALPVIFTPLSLFSVLLLGRNAFGIRRKQGRAYLSAFETTQAYGTTQLAVLKILVKSVCVLVALIVIAVSAWMSLPLLGDAVFIQMMGLPLSRLQSAISVAAVSLTGYEQLSLVVVAAVCVAVWVTSWAALDALRIRYSRRVTIASVLLVLYGLVFVWLAVGLRVGDPATASRLHLDVVYGAMCWIVTAAIVITTVHVYRSGFAEHVLTVRYASGAVAIAAAFGLAWLTALHITGAQLAEMSVMNAISVVSPALLPLMASGLAPWSYSRIRSL